MFVNRYLIGYLQGVKMKMLFVIIFSLAVTLLASGVSLLTAIIVDVLLRDGSMRMFSSFTQIYSVIAAGIIVSFALAVLRARQAEKLGVIVKDNVRMGLIEKLFMLGPAYTSKSRTGTLASTVTSRVERLKHYYTGYLPLAASAIINAAVFTAALLRVDMVSGIAALIACVGMIACPMIFFPLMKAHGAKELDAHAKYYSDCLDGIQGISTLKALNANRQQVQKIAENGESLRKTIMSHLKVTMTEGAVMEFFARGGSAITIAVLVMRHMGGHIPAEHTIFAYFFAAACFTQMLVLINAWHLGFMGVSASYSINELLDEKVVYSLTKSEKSTAFPQRKLSGDSLPAQRRSHSPIVDGDISFNEVSFAYNSTDGEVLHGINLTVKKGTMTALVGSSGSGKSIIAHLLAGFYPVGTGGISIGGTTINSETVGAVQEQIAAVWQDSHLFYGTVYENIQLGKPGAPEEEVHAAAKAVNLHDFILSLPEGYNTPIGERGTRFSGGERQRIAIARAYLRGAPILIFDEATSSLDRQNEIAIQDSFEILSQGRTSLVIAHRLSTIMNADRICILDKGRIAAVGKHDELLNESKLYRKLVGTQVGGTELHRHGDSFSAEQRGLNTLRKGKYWYDY